MLSVVLKVWMQIEVLRHKDQGFLHQAQPAESDLIRSVRSIFLFIFSLHAFTGFGEHCCVLAPLVRPRLATCGRTAQESP